MTDQGETTYNPFCNLQQRKSGYLEIILGPMFSGKTTALYNIYTECVENNIPVLVINHSFDNRYDNNNKLLYTHNLQTMPCISTNTLYFIPGAPSILKEVDTILINEGQFFDDLTLYTFVDHLLKLKKRVYVCGLDGDYKRKKFGGILDLIPLCDKVTKLNSVCSLCKDGTPGLFSKRITDEKDVVVVGSNNYLSVCRLCYEK